MTDETYDAGARPVDPNLLNLLKAIEETDLCLQEPFQSFEDYLQTLLNKAGLERSVAQYDADAS